MNSTDAACTTKRTCLRWRADASGINFSREGRLVRHFRHHIPEGELRSLLRVHAAERGHRKHHHSEEGGRCRCLPRFHRHRHHHHPRRRRRRRRRLTIRAASLPVSLRERPPQILSSALPRWLSNRRSDRKMFYNIHDFLNAYL